MDRPDTTGTANAAVVLSLRGSAGIPSTTFLKSPDRLIERWHANGLEVIVCGVPDELRRELDHVDAGARLRDSIVGRSGGVVEAVREAYELGEQRRLAATTQQSSADT